jgi:hypothetical protein
MEGLLQDRQQGLAHKRLHRWGQRRPDLSGLDGDGWERLPRWRRGEFGLERQE